MAGEGHIPLAATPDPQGAAPVTGAVDECEVTFGHEMSVRRIYESPRVTKPYTDEQWKQIDALGRFIDTELKAHDVRLTMGGEPTFVSIDDMDGAEWNFTALGPAKRASRGRARPAPEEALRAGRAAALRAGQVVSGRVAAALGARLLVAARRRAAVARRSAHRRRDQGLRAWRRRGAAASSMRLAEALAVDRDHVIPAYEDVWHYLMAERRLPVNVDPLKSELKNEEERARLARVFEQGLDTIVGYVLPVKRRNESAGRGWTSGPWFLRSEHLFLIPGDSPIGYRLPLDSLPWATPADTHEILEADPFARRDPLPRRQLAVRPEARVGAAPAVPAAPAAQVAVKPPPRGKSAPGVIRTALCVEPRHGRLHVFMPPVESTEDYIDLVAAIERTAAQLEDAGHHRRHAARARSAAQPPQGDAGPRRHRGQHASRAQLAGDRRADLHALRRGAPDPARDREVPARRPAHRHRRRQPHGPRRRDAGRQPVPAPARSPAQPPRLLAQSPVAVVPLLGALLRPDEPASARRRGRNDSLHELEIAFTQVPPRGDAPAPWLVDRVFRHLLVDLTGNTHRTEFCIDKLYAPETSSGRQGLVELRSFEMPPHARMSLAQQLLLRALVARFWKTPYNQSLVRWGTELHDRFMLPHFVADDLGDVLDDLGRSGYAMQPDWFAPHLEFRFPRVRRRSRGAACTSSCARRSSRGTCSGKSRARAARSATSTRRSNASRSRSRA